VVSVWFFPATKLALARKFLGANPFPHGGMICLQIC
jgi:hypothetical protein